MDVAATEVRQAAPVVGAGVRRAAPGLTSNPQPVAGPPSPQLEAATAAARACDSLVELRAALERLDGCALRMTSTNLCFGTGPAAPPLLVVGEVPGAEEDRSGLPFQGEAGLLLDRMLRAIGLDREAVWVGHAVYWRPPGNRSVTPLELALCRPFLLRQLELVAPALVLLAGSQAVRQVLGSPDGVKQRRGKLWEWQGPERSGPAIVTFAPCDLLQSPPLKKWAWHDLLAVQDLLADAAAAA